MTMTRLVISAAAFVTLSTACASAAPAYVLSTVNLRSAAGTNNEDGSVILIDGATNSVESIEDTLPNPFGIAIDQETGHIYVAHLAGPGTHGNIVRGNANDLEEDFDPPTGPNGLPLPDGFPLVNPGALIGFTRNPVVNPANHKVYTLISGGTNVSVAMLDPATNKLRSKAELAAIAAKLPEGPIVAYCNTGHWAATNWFVLSALLGRPDVRLYDGSMVEWTADARRPLASARTRWDDVKRALGFGS